ncbi:hypothetical protein ACJ41O_015178 [Fusarium nematophilum]
MGKIASMEYFRVPPRWLLVKITDETGAIGWGEASLEGHTEAVEGCLHAWFERYKGMDAENIENIWQLSWRGSFYRGGPVFMSALSGIDIALWDMKESDLTPTSQARKEQGFRAVKMNGTGDTAWLDSPSALKEVVDRLKIVKAVGIDAAVDFHGRVHKPMAKRLARALEPHEPLFIEEPLLSEHIGGIKQLSDLTTVPIALGERLHSRWDVRPFLESGAVDILQPDICHVGGISEMRRIAAMCETYDVGVAPHCPLGPIALAANLHVNATMPNFAIQEMGIGMHYNNTGQDITSYITNPEVWAVRDGHVDVLSGPGLGIEINEEEVRQRSKDTKSWPVPEFRGPCGELREW